MSRLTLSTHSMNSSMSSSSASSSSSVPTRTRKSTLTQQQKNKKRQRATPSQLIVLRKEFEINNTPNAKTREEIGRKIDMTERSVQIWFQNKRAKQKLFSRKHNIYGLGTLSPLGTSMNNGYITGSNDSPIDDSCRSTPNGMVGYGGGPNKSLFLSPYGGIYSAFSKSTTSLDVGGGDNNGRQMLRGYGNLASLIVFSCSSLRIGSWRRIASANTTNGLVPDDLIILYSPAESMFTYLMFDGTTRFRMEFPAKAVDKVTLSVDENNPMAGIINLRLNSRPSFSVKTPKVPDRWLVCGDFSVSEQASKFTMHKLTGPYSELHSQISQLYSFQPAKVSAGLLTPPQTATTMVSDKKIDPIGNGDYAQRKDNNLWLNIPERSQTKSTPAVFTNSININLRDIAADSILAFGDSVSDNDLEHSPLGEGISGDDLMGQSNDSNNGSLFSEPNGIPWNNIDVHGDAADQFGVGNEYFQLRVETPPIEMMFPVDSSGNDIGMVSPDSDDVGKRRKDDEEKPNQVVVGLDDGLNYSLEGGSAFQNLGDNFELSYGGSSFL